MLKLRFEVIYLMEINQSPDLSLKLHLTRAKLILVQNMVKIVKSEIGLMVNELQYLDIFIIRVHHFINFVGKL